MKPNDFTNRNLDLAFTPDHELPDDLANLLDQIDARDHPLFPNAPDHCAKLDDFELSAADVARIWTEGDADDRRMIDQMLDAKREQQRRDQTDWFKFD